jgi:hypothetical protein
VDNLAFGPRCRSPDHSSLSPTHRSSCFIVPLFSSWISHTTLRRLRQLFLVLVDVRPAVLLATSLISFSRRRHSHRAVHYITRFYHSPTTFPSCCSQYRVFRSLVEVLPAALLAVLILSFSWGRLVRGSAHPHRSFLSLADILPAARYAGSLVSFTRRDFPRCAARCIVCFLHSLRSFPPCRSLHRSFLSDADVLPAAPLAVSLVTFYS